MMKTLALLFLLINFTVSAMSENLDGSVLIAKSDQISGLDATLKEANKFFTYKGKPIPPSCIEEFNVNLAESGPPMVSAVDVESCVTDNATVDFKVNEDGYAVYKIGDAQDQGFFGYKYIGKAEGGLHVLDTLYSSGGTMVAKTIFLTRFKIDKYRSFDEHGSLSIEKRLILKCVGQIVRGDRDVGQIEIKNNEIILGKSQYRKNIEVIKLD